MKKSGLSGKVLLSALLVLVFATSIVWRGTASPVPAITQTSSMTTVYLDPPTINGTVDEEFNVSIMIRNAPDIMVHVANNVILNFNL